jgi:hypothetical protein
MQVRRRETLIHGHNHVDERILEYKSTILLIYHQPNSAFCKLPCFQGFLRIDALAFDIFAHAVHVHMECVEGAIW